ncbi:MAG: tRNA 2-thiouridine(34) synthase MnmA [Oscillospiraceae bacterium]|jgi:tRNA-specific 2-thiouridylase|nr:tRNA 2-thiouridine(34) synthase MnmA [Oscillospiraceae bacterium]
MGGRVLIAMSGGVDSSVAAYLLKARGFDCAGATMKLFDGEETRTGGRTCCSLEDVSDAKSVAYRLDIPHYVFNFTEEFKERVIGGFVEAYQNGATPNPCVDCNRHIKFEKLLSRAKQLGADYLATGHYARIERDLKTGRYLLKKAADEAKDQSYFLYSMTQEQLAGAMFPLGGLYKANVRLIAAEQGFLNAKKRDSQDICFVRDGDYAGFIERYTGKVCESGDFTDTRGCVLGRHKGLIRYTAGQRRGLGLSFPKPLYVRSKNPENNTVTLCEESGLFTKSLNAVDFNWIAIDEPRSPVRVEVKTRHGQKERRATAKVSSPGKVYIEFDEPQRAIAKGQAVALYDGDTVVGGGTISDAF